MSFTAAGSLLAFLELTPAKGSGLPVGFPLCLSQLFSEVDVIFFEFANSLAEARDFTVALLATAAGRQHHGELPFSVPC
jgi:hypothetical protein